MNKVLRNIVIATTLIVSSNISNVFAARTPARNLETQAKSLISMIKHTDSNSANLNNYNEIFTDIINELLKLYKNKALSLDKINESLDEIITRLENLSAIYTEQANKLNKKLSSNLTSRALNKASGVLQKQALIKAMLDEVKKALKDNVEPEFIKRKKKYGRILTAITLCGSLAPAFTPALTTKKVTSKTKPSTESRIITGLETTTCPEPVTCPTCPAQVTCPAPVVCTAQVACPACPSLMGRLGQAIQTVVFGDPQAAQNLSQ